MRGPETELWLLRSSKILIVEREYFLVCSVRFRDSSSSPRDSPFALAVSPSTFRLLPQALCRNGTAAELQGPWVLMLYLWSAQTSLAQTSVRLGTDQLRAWIKDK